MPRSRWSPGTEQVSGGEEHGTEVGYRLPEVLSVHMLLFTHVPLNGVGHHGAENDPVVAYKEEGYEMFENMVAAIQEETLRRLFLVRLRKNEEVKRERVAKVTGESGEHNHPLQLTHQGWSDLLLLAGIYLGGLVQQQLGQSASVVSLQKNALRSH